MSKYLIFIKNGFKENFIYRTNSYLMILGSLIGLLITVSIWKALYINKTSVQGITLSDMITAVILNSIILSFTYSRIADNLANKVHDGSIATDLVKPFSLKWSMFSTQVGANIFKFVFSSLPILIVAVIFLDFRLPESSAFFVVFVVSFINGIILSFILNYLIGLWAFWLKKASYPTWFLNAAFDLFGGSVVPLWFYPDALYAISALLPFRFIFFEPVKIFLMKCDINEAIYIILMQFFWIGVLFALEKLIWSRVERNITVFGG